MSTFAYRGILGRFPRQGDPVHCRHDVHHPHPLLYSGMFCRGHGVEGFSGRGQVFQQPQRINLIPQGIGVTIGSESGYVVAALEGLSHGLFS